MFRLLEKRTGTAIVQIQFFKHFYHFHIEECEETTTGTKTYAKMKMTKDECIQHFLNDGFKEKELKK